MSDAPSHPDIAVSPTARPFWEGLNEGRVMLQWCRQCDRSVWYPREFCPNCLTENNPLEWIEASGRGRVHTYTVIRQAAHPFFQEQVPYIFGVVELAERARMMTNFLCDPDEIEVGMPVEAVIVDGTDDQKKLHFKPIGT